VVDGVGHELGEDRPDVGARGGVDGQHRDRRLDEAPMVQDAEEIRPELEIHAGALTHGTASAVAPIPRRQLEERDVVVLGLAVDEPRSLLDEGLEAIVGIVRAQRRLHPLHTELVAGLPLDLDQPVGEHVDPVPGAEGDEVPHVHSVPGHDPEGYAMRHDALQRPPAVPPDEHVGHAAVPQLDGLTILPHLEGRNGHEQLGGQRLAQPLVDRLQRRAQLEAVVRHLLKDRRDGHGPDRRLQAVSGEVAEHHPQAARSRVAREQEVAVESGQRNGEGAKPRILEPFGALHDLQQPGRDLLLTNVPVLPFLQLLVLQREPGEEPMSTEARVQAAVEHDPVDRLRDEVVGSSRDALDQALLVAEGGQQQDRHVSAAAPLLDDPGGLKPVEPGHDDVQEHDVGLKVGEDLQCLFAGLGDGDGVVRRLEDPREEDAVHSVVVDDEHSSHSGLSRTRTTSRNGRSRRPFEPSPGSP
jgi:hypothetical protein